MSLVYHLLEVVPTTRDWKADVLTMDRQQLPQFRGQFVAIDVETEDFEVSSCPEEASDRLWQRHLEAQILVERIGHIAVFYATACRA